MKIIIITQNEPFYLVNNLKYLLKILPNHIKIIGCVVSDVSPFGKKESFFKKTIKTYKIFGKRFFLYYGIRFIYYKLFKKNLYSFLSENNIERITLHKPINSFDSINQIKKYNPDLLLSILGNEIFKKDIINLAPLGCINLHTSLLPKYRGLMPTFWVLKNNEKYTGVSVFYVDEGIDSGPIIVQKKIMITEKNQKKLIQISKKIGMDAICEALILIFNNKVRLIKNNNEKKSYFSFPSRKDVIEFRNSGNKFF